ncbi:hypothetical protein Tco_1080425 [Tanacetum coccineum]|uniref:Uncharacterized protein n=1 Tax=Tanacetum coccineum TaxID=301880 RepID=A0ABQ5HV64_9ASTR
METEVESMVTVPIQQVSSSVPLLILQSSISHLLNQYLLPVKNHSLQLSPPTSALQQSSSVLEMKMKDWPMDKEVADKVKDHKRKHDSDDDDDEGPTAGSNQGKSTKRRRHDSGASGSAQPPTKD